MTQSFTSGSSSRATPTMHKRTRTVKNKFSEGKITVFKDEKASRAALIELSVQMSMINSRKTPSINKPLDYVRRDNEIYGGTSVSNSS